MAVLPIVRYPDARLRQRSQEVVSFDGVLHKLVTDMADTMFAAEGAGLAAIQVGVPLRLFLIDAGVAGRGPTDSPLVFINPELVGISDEAQTGDEGCLSFPGIRGDVVRPDRITVEFQDNKGMPHLLICDGLLARCVQHEVDHLNGILFIDHMDKPTLAGIDAELKALKKQTRTAAKKE